VIYHLRHAAKTAGERGLLVEKFVVAHVGEPLEFGRRVQAEARRRGLGEAPQVFVVADGGVWIWNIVADRFAAATGVLDFYHASQHLWDLAHTLHPDNEAGARAWVEPLLHQLRHGGEAGCCKPCRTCRRGACNAHRPCPRPWRAKSITSRNIGSISIMRRARRKAVPSAAARWNPCAGNSKAGSNGAASSGRNPAVAASWPSKSPVATKIGTKSGSQIKNSVKMHPL